MGVSVQRDDILGQDGEEGKSRDRRYEPGRGGQHVDAREQTRGIRTDVIELAAGETVVVTSEIAGPHASRRGGSLPCFLLNLERDEHALGDVKGEEAALDTKNREEVL